MKQMRMWLEALMRIYWEQFSRLVMEFVKDFTIIEGVTWEGRCTPPPAGREISG